MPRSKLYVLPNIPFQYRGGKLNIADEIWKRFGDPHVYVEVFSGRADTLFCRPQPPTKQRYEYLNDIDCMVINFYRAVQHNADGLAALFDSDPLSTVDMQARQGWLVDHKPVVTGLLEDPKAYDLQAAQYWVYLQCLLPDTSACKGKRQQVTLGHSVDMLKYPSTVELLRAMTERLRKVRLIRGDWKRMLRQHPRGKHMIVAQLFDPPYSPESGRKMGMYDHDSPTVAREAAEEAVKKGRNPNYRIAFCGFADEFYFPPNWEELEWESPKAAKENRGRERIWFSPGCLKVEDDQKAA